MNKNAEWLWHLPELMRRHGHKPGQSIQEKSPAFTAPEIIEEVPMKLTHEQNAWLIKQPRELADHIRKLLKEDESYTLLSRDNGKTFILSVLPVSASDEQREDD